MRDDIVSEDESNVYNDYTPDPKQIFKNIRDSNFNKLTFGHLNINSLRNKFDQLTELVKGFIDILLIFESKLDDSFPEGQFIIDGYHHPSGLIDMGMEGDFCYMSERTRLKKFYTVIFLLLKVFMLRLFSIRKDGS